MEFLDIKECNHCCKNINETNKLTFGEVKTDFYVIDIYFLNKIPDEVYQNKNLKWLDPGSGTGNFSICIFKRLMFSLHEQIEDIELRKKHIIENMLYMVELNSENVKILKNIFGEKANIYSSDYLLFNEDTKFDIIIGNPPYNSKGLKKVPTNNEIEKVNDGNTVWTEFIKKSLHLLKEDGYLSMIIPAIWLKPDKAKIYDLLTRFKILKLKSFTNTQSNKIFAGNSQTPSTIFLLQKKNTDNIISIFDEKDKIHNYYLKENNPIPIFGISIINKLQKYIDLYDHIKVLKTNLPAKHIEIFEKKKNDSNYQNITTCILDKSSPKMIYNYSFLPCPYYNKPKLVLAHGMYGFPFLDEKGLYGISNRDKYVILDKSVDDLNKIKTFLSTNLALYVFECFKYRMKYLEKYAFQMIPDITLIKDFPEKITNKSVNDYFKFTEYEIENINSLHKKSYNIT
tara:strand:- start:834 stop:2198 length:1365 start_codon:yes stop_codon:yes gene_type:complete